MSAKTNKGLKWGALKKNPAFIQSYRTLTAGCLLHLSPDHSVTQDTNNQMHSRCFWFTFAAWKWPISMLIQISQISSKFRPQHCIFCLCVLTVVSSLQIPNQECNSFFTSKNMMQTFRKPVQPDLHDKDMFQTAKWGKIITYTEHQAQPCT